MSTINLDNECFDSIEVNINMSIPWYLMACYAYYVEDNPILSDSYFDRLTKIIIDNWNKIEHHHKEKLNLDMLQAGTFLGEYPSRVEGGLKSLRDIYGKPRTIS